MYTDGVTEAFNKNKELFSDERLKEEVTTNKKESVESLVNKILHEVKVFSQGAAQSDDITVLVLKYFSAKAKPSETLGKSKTFILANDLPEIPNLAHHVREFGERNNLSERIIHDMNLALEELIANIISYAYEDSMGHDITITMNLTDKDLILEVKDDGKPFNPLQAPEPDIEKPLEERKVGGLGIFLIRNLMDTLDYKREEGYNILVIKKKVA
jgi:sigma-B regulation protein RsbU (phosphoserine phosphatase)